MIIFVQFGISTLAVCFSLYVLVTAKTTNMKTVMDLVYISGLLVQIFFYCWHGNELKLKVDYGIKTLNWSLTLNRRIFFQSSEVSEMIFESDWTELSKETKKILSVIMIRTTMCIEFTSFHIVVMNLASFINVSIRLEINHFSTCTNYTATMRN